MGDFNDLFRHFFWLIFPVFGMIAGLLYMNQRHDQSLKVLDMIKSYADQGKEPPPELMAALRQANCSNDAKAGSNWLPFFLFTALATGFVLFALVIGGSLREMVPFLFVALIMAGMAIGLLVNMLAGKASSGTRPQ